MEVKVAITEGVTVKVEGTQVVFTGSLGEVKQALAYPGIKTEIKDNNLVFSSEKDSKKVKRMVNTFISHAKNAMEGVTEGFKYEMKMVFTHFPMTVKVEGNRIRIDNLTGERSARYSKIMGDSQVKITKQDIEITGIDLYNVSQTAANLEQAARIVGLDRRVFQDGIYITKKKAK